MITNIMILWQGQLSALPADVTNSILLGLNPVQLAMVRCSCHALHTSASAEHLWRLLVSEYLQYETNESNASACSNTERTGHGQKVVKNMWSSDAACPSSMIAIDPF